MVFIIFFKFFLIFFYYEFRLKENGELVQKQEMNMFGDRSLTTSQLFRLSSGDFIINGAAGTFDGFTFYSTCHYNLIKVDLDKLNISATEDFVSQSGKPYPNPSSGPLTIDIQGINGMADLRVFDMTGRNVFVKHGLGIGSATIDLSDLAPGTFVYKLYQGNKMVSSGKWVKVE